MIVGTNGTAASDINDLGQIVGDYYDSNSTEHGFLYSSGAYTTSPLRTIRRAPMARRAYGINDAGQIVGYYSDSNGTPHGFLYNGGNYTTLNDPLGTKGTLLTASTTRARSSGSTLTAAA